MSDDHWHRPSAVGRWPDPRQSLAPGDPRRPGPRRYCANRTLTDSPSWVRLMASASAGATDSTVSLGWLTGTGTELVQTTSVTSSAAASFSSAPSANSPCVQAMLIDLGYAKSAAAFARRLGVPVAAGAKERFNDEKVTISSIIGDVSDQDVIILDDEIARGTTVIELLSVLRAQEPRSISIACTHGLFADGALEKLAAAEDVNEIVCTNSVPVPVSHPKLTVLSVAPALAEAIRRTHDGESVSVLFAQ